MHCTYKSHHYADASLQETGLQGWQQSYTQTGRGAFTGAISRFDLGGISLIEERLNVAVAQETCPPEGKLLLIFSETRRIDGNVSAHRGIVHTGGNEIQLATETGHRSLVILADLSKLPDFGCHKAPPIFALQNSDDVETSAFWVESVLRSAPDLIRHNPDDVPILSAIIEDRVSDVCSAFFSAGSRQGLNQTYSSRLVRRAMILADELVFEPLTVTRLTHELGVPDHVLRTAFLQCTGVSTYTWLRKRRLKRARWQILRAKAEGRRVAEIAMENGFFHLGRFAAYYSETFGETPVETLRL